MYGSGTVRETGRPFICFFAGKKEVLGSNPGLNRTFCFFPPFIFCAFSLKQGSTVSHYIYLLQNICIDGKMSQK